MVSEGTNQLVPLDCLSYMPPHVAWMVASTTSARHHGPIQGSKHPIRTRKTRESQDWTHIPFPRPPDPVTFAVTDREEDSRALDLLRRSCYLHQVGVWNMRALLVRRTRQEGLTLFMVRMGA